MKKLYEAPELELLEFQIRDVITESDDETDQDPIT